MAGSIVSGISLLYEVKVEPRAAVLGSLHARGWFCQGNSIKQTFCFYISMIGKMILCVFINTQQLSSFLTVIAHISVITGVRDGVGCADFN